MKFSIIAILFSLAVYAFAEDGWNAYCDPYPIHDVVAYGDDGILLATEGGIRFRTVDGDFVFHSGHGLETSSFYSIVSSKDLGTFAISEFGLIAAINEDGKTWRVVNRSYLKNNVRVVSGESELGGHFLVIAFEDRLAFFDLFKATSLLTIDRVGSHSLPMNPIKKIAVHGDSLYVKMDRAVYVRVMDWEHLSEDVHLGDPYLWTKLGSDSPIEEFKPWDSTKVVVGGEELTDYYLFDNGVSLSKWYVRSKDGYYMVGPEAPWFKRDDGSPRIQDMRYEQYTLGGVYELHATPLGGVLAASLDGKMSYGNKVGWRDPSYVYEGLGNADAAYAARMKVLAMLPDESVFYHIWGFVYQIYSHWGNELEMSFKPTDGFCFDNYLENYPISSYAIPAPDSSGFLTATASTDGFSIVYFRRNGDVSCASQIGSTVHRTIPGPMYAKEEEDGSWLVYVASRKGTALSEEGGLDLFRFPSPTFNGGELVDGTLVASYRGLSPGAIDMAYDSSSNRLWLVSMSNLAYLDEDLDSLIVPSSTNGLLGAEYTSIEVDVHGNLWLGTTNQGVFRLTQKGNTPDTLSVIRYTSRDGLISDNVSDVALDAVNGIAWFAHDNGVSYYQRNDLRYAGKNMTDSTTVRFKTYPIPFRPKEHKYFTIEGITEDAVVSFYNRGGAMVRSFKNDEVAGGILEWDGCGKDGQLVAPGVYYYVIRHSGKVKKGKFIVIH